MSGVGSDISNRQSEPSTRQHTQFTITLTISTQAFAHRSMYDVKCGLVSGDYLDVAPVLMGQLHGPSHEDVTRMCITTSASLPSPALRRRATSPSCSSSLTPAPTPPILAGGKSPLNQATLRGHTATAALLRRAIAEADRARFLLKARCLVDFGLPSSITQGRAVREEFMPHVEMVPQRRRGRGGRWRQDEQERQEVLWATVAFALGLEIRHDSTGPQYKYPASVGAGCKDGGGGVVCPRISPCPRICSRSLWASWRTKRPLPGRGCH